MKTHPSNCFVRHFSATRIFSLATFLCSTGITLAQNTWDGNGDANASGNWSTLNLWNPDATGSGPTGTAILGDVTSGTRTITFDSSAPATVATLEFNQSTAEAVNGLLFAKSATVTNAITLGAAAGTERITVGTSSNATLTPSGGITVNAGGELVLASYNTTTTNYVNGNLGGSATTTTISGGTLTIATPSNWLLSAGGSLNVGITGNLTMSSGSFIIDNGSGATATGPTDRRVTIGGNVDISGGSIRVTHNTNGGSLLIAGATNTISSTSIFDTKLLISLNRDGAQTLSSGVALGDLQIRSTGIKTISNSATGQNIGTVSFIDGNSATQNSAPTLKLGSNLTLVSGKGMPSAASFSQTIEASGRIDFGIDTNGYTLDLSPSGGWTPNASTSTGVTNTVWTLSDTAGSGAIKANSFNLSTANVTTHLGAGTTLVAVGGSSTATNLGGTGTINASSTFRYAGTATTGSPATLTSSRDLGKIEVTSGALRVLSTSTGSMQSLSVSASSTFDLSQIATTSQTIPAITGEGTVALGAKNLTIGGATDTTFPGVISGTGGSLTKLGAGTLTLSGANTYTGATTVEAGTLETTTANRIADGSALVVNAGTFKLAGLNGAGGDTVTSLSGTGGTVDVTTNLLALSGSVGVTRTYGGNITGNFPTSAGTMTAGSMGVEVRGGTQVFTGNITLSADTATYSGMNRAYLRPTGSGTLELAGNTTLTNVQLYPTGTATLRFNGGTHQIVLGANGNFAMQVDSSCIVDGDASVTANNISLGFGGLGSASLTVNSGSLTLSDASGINLGNGLSSGLSTVNLNGGTVTTKGFVNGAASPSSGVLNTINYNGGKLVCGATTVFPSTSNASGNFLIHKVGNGGAVIDTAGFNNTVSRPFVADGSGGLTKLGLGTLTLTGVNTYTGDTTVSAGVLAVNGSALPDSGKLVISGGKVQATGTEVVDTLFFGVTQQRSGTWGATGSGATHIDDTRFAGTTGVISVTTGSSLYDAWADGTFVPPLTAKLPSDDQDGDSLTNLQEYAFGTQPTVSTGEIAYSGETLTTPGAPKIVTAAGTYSMVFGRRADYVAAGLTYTVQFSTALEAWVDNNDETNPPVQVATDGTINAMSVPYPDRIETLSGPRKPTFSRVKVVLAP
jgi:autotransporter-associated beta strand protein